jgi:hypothetical protein
MRVMRLYSGARLFALVTWLACASATAAEVRVWTEPEDIYMGVPFNLMVQASGGSVGDFELPEFDGLVVEEPPNVRRDQMRYSMGEREEVRVRGYRARATRTGLIRVPPVTVRVDGREVRSNGLTMTAREPAERSPDPRVSDYVLLDAEVSKDRVFLGEPLVFTVRLYELQHRSVMVEAIALEMPSTEGFYSAQFDDDPRPRYPDTLLRDGRRYEEALRRRTLLCPTAPGELTVGSAQLRANIYLGSGFQTRRFSELFTTAPQSIEVAPLPPAPDSFTGAVGRLTVSAAVPDEAAREGVPLELMVEVRGECNPDAVSGPPLPEGARWSFREPRSRIEWLDTDPPSMSKTFVYALTPLASGTVTIPSFSFCHFDPEREEYVVTELGPFPLNVLPAADPDRRVVLDEGLQPEGPAVQRISTDIRGFQGHGGALARRGTPGWQLGAAVAAPPLAWAGIALVVTRRRWAGSNAVRARFGRARARARKDLAAATQGEDPMAELYRVLRQYIADKTAADPNGMTADDARRALAGAGADDASVRDAYRLLRDCERARYAGGRLGSEAVEQQARAVRQVVDRLETSLSRKSGR